VTDAGPPLVGVGLSYRTAPIGQREKAALDDELAARVLDSLVTDPRIAEAAALSTCNRTEVYVVCDDPDLGARAAASALVRSSRISASELDCASYVFEGGAAARHLLRVAGGLDSMVLGEPEVQGQVRRAAQLAREAGAIGPLLERLFRQALFAGGRVRRDTGICDGPTSVSSVALTIALRALPDLASRRALLVGAGEMAGSMGRALVRNGLRDVVVANRTLSTAHLLAGELGGRAAPLRELDGRLRDADLVVCTTDAPQPMVRRDAVATGLWSRPERPLLLLDLAVPRDVEPEVAGVSGAVLYDIDDVERELKKSFDGRRRALADAERIVDDELARFLTQPIGRARPYPLARALSSA
jgi:glutamyl-tRNA reductase